MESKVRLDPSWLNVLGDEFSKSYFSELKSFLVKEKQNGTVIYPPGHRIFAALDETPFNLVKVVVLGQDPYHGQGQANGLCFSVSRGIAVPPSLKNIYKELQSDLGLRIPEHGDLENWAQQGVLLLNAVLTVRAGQAASHQHKGWEQFTDAIIRLLSEKKSNLVFMLWGNFARSKKHMIDTGKHLVLEAAHPSPFSADGFLGCRHFSKANEFLKSKGIAPVDWSLS